MNARAEIKICGQVHDVFFRDFIAKESEILGVTGFVRNSVDGTVEVIAEGDRKSLKELAERCRKGPPLASVEKVEVAWRAFRGEFSDFRIRY